MDHNMALEIICKGNPLLQPKFPEEVIEKLVADGLARPVISGGLKATDAGMRKIHGT